MDKAVSRWETGNAYPDIALLDDLAAVLTVSVEELCRHYFAGILGSPSGPSSVSCCRFCLSSG